MPTSCLVVLTTLPSRAKARQLTKLLLQNHLAACVNVLGPVESYFWWKGKIDCAKEHLLFIKTRTASFNRLRRFLEKHHPYSVPEIVAWPLQKGNSSYLNWVRTNVR